MASPPTGQGTNVVCQHKRPSPFAVLLEDLIDLTYIYSLPAATAMPAELVMVVITEAPLQITR